MLDKVVGRYPIRLNKSINSNLALESQNRYTIIHVTPSSRSSRRIRKPITLGRRNERRYTTRTLKDAQSERKCKRTQLMLVRYVTRSAPIFAFRGLVIFFTQRDTLAQKVERQDRKQ